MTALNAAWQAASEEMYKATNEANANPTGDANANPNADGSTGQQGSTADDNVKDVDFEEVKDNK